MTRRREWALIVFAATILAFVGYFLVAAVQSSSAERRLANRAVTASQTIATNAHSRITQLQSQITHLERQIQASTRQRSRQIGKLEAKVRVLIRQVRGLGGTPVVTEHVVTVHSKTKRVIVQPTPRPRPRPTVTPSPQPTCAIGVCLPRTRTITPGQARKPKH